MKKILVGIVAIALIACLVGSASACAGPGLSPGFWKHNVGVYLGLQNGAYSDPGYTGGTVSKATMHDWLLKYFDYGHDGGLLKELYDQLSTTGGGAAGAASRVAAANRFNAQADLYPYV
jgi:hypothetical protein